MQDNNEETAKDLKTQLLLHKNGADAMQNLLKLEIVDSKIKSSSMLSHLT